MKNLIVSPYRRWFLLAAGLLLGFVSNPLCARAYTPDHPKVKAMVAQGVKYLKSASPTSGGQQVGLTALQGLGLIKAGVSKTDPAVVKCAQVVAKAANGKRDPNNLDSMWSSSYSVCVAIIFLCELDRNQYRNQIEFFKGRLLGRQSVVGAVSYEDDPIGDVSQTQYAALAFWELDHHGFDVPTANIVRMLQWFLTVQNKDGSWGYKISVSPAQLMKGRVGGGKVTRALAAGGTGSCYILADMLRLPSSKGAEKKGKKRVEIPPPLKLPNRVEKSDAPRVSFPAAPLAAAQRDGSAWLHNKDFTMFPEEHHPIYYMYGYERYAAFRDKALGKNEPEPKWYNLGVDLLAKKQSPGGEWNDDAAGGLAGTAFALMFLTRSTRKTVGTSAFSEGELRGGRGLPGDTSRVVFRNGRVEAVPVAKSFTDLMGILDDPTGDELAMIAALPDATEIKHDKAAYARNAARLRRMAEHEKYEVRVVAVRALARARDIENVPTLIYALSDPDWNVIKEARDGLRFVSRKFDGFGMKQGMSKEEIGSITEKWRRWFLSVRPDAELR